MATALLVARLLLSAVFVSAAIGKLLDLEGSRAATAAFGVPGRLARPVGTLLPFVEFAIAVLLLPATTAVAAALGAVALLWLFIAAIARSLSRGQAPDCHCFGALHSQPAGPATLARNGGLLAIAGFVIAGGWGDAGTSATAWLVRLPDAGVVALSGGVLAVAIVLGGGVTALALLRQNGRLLIRVDALEARLAEAGLELSGVHASASTEPRFGLRAGAPAPPFRLDGLYGETVTLDALVASERPVALVFTDPGCGPCNAMLPALGAWQRELAGSVTIAVLTRGDPDTNRAKFREHAVAGVLLDSQLSVYNAYLVPGTPAAVVIGTDGRIASAVGGGAPAIEELLRQAAGGLPAVVHVPAVMPSAVERPAAVTPPQAPPGLPVGAVAPEFELPDLGGRPVRPLADRSGDTLVLFWNPGCGYCREMLPALREWEAQRPANAPRLVVVSTGAAEAHAEMGLSAEVLLDHTFATATAYGSTVTPSATLVDADGRAASGLAIGADAVMELASRRSAAP